MMLPEMVTMDVKKEEFVKPSAQAPRRSNSLKAPTTSSNFDMVSLLNESKTTNNATEGFRLVLASVRFIVNKVRTGDLIEPVVLLKELSRVTSLLVGFNEILITELFKCKILYLEAEILEEFLQFLVEMGRTHTFHHFEICRLILQSFVALEDPLPTDGNLEVTHKCLEKMLKELPHFSESFVKCLGKNLPFMTKSHQSQIHFYRNMLKTVDYAPTHLTTEILARIIHKIIDLDCHCSKEEMIAAEKTEDLQFQIEMSAEDGEAVPTESSAVCDKEIEMKLPLANTLDRIMEVLFEYVDSHSTEIQESKKIFQMFLDIFDRFILSTYKCLHIQFLMFVICSKRPLFADRFIDFLWQKIENPSTPVIFRQISAYYLGSLLSRSKFISIGTLKDSLNVMCRFLQNYLAQSSSAHSANVDIAKHATFYSVCQSVLYIIAFLHREIVESNNGLNFMKNLCLEQIITSSLNPLKVIYPTVGLNFANVSRHYQIVYCHSIIEKNQRGALPMAHQENKQQKLDIYFPFDPYVLLRSKKWIDPIYRDYENHLDIQDNDDSGGESDNEEPMVCGSASRSVSEKMFSYSVSPGFIQSQ